MEKLEKLFGRLFSIDISKLNDSISMKDTARWDSLNHMRLISEIENTFEVDLEMDDIIEMTTLGKIRSILTEKYNIV